MFQKYYQVLHPRTAGFCFLVNQLQKRKHFDAIYDLTIVYADHIPQTEHDILKGSLPNQIYCHIKRYGSTEVPSTEEELKTFLTQKWMDKEHELANFEKTNQFFIKNSQLIQFKNRSNIYLLIPFIFWTILPFLTLYIILTNYYFQILVLIHTLVLLTITVLGDTFLNFEIFLYYLKPWCLR